MQTSYESYRAECHAQLVTPLTRAAWDRENEMAKPHTVDFTVKAGTDASLAPGRYRNHFGANHKLIRTERLEATGRK